MKNYIDEKVTVWKRYHFTDNSNMQKLADQIKTTQDVYDVLEEEHGFCTCETLDETEIFIPVEGNDGQSTIEVYQDDKEIWNNGAIKDEQNLTRLSFVDRLNELAKTAIMQIESLLHTRQQVVLFEATAKEDDEWTKDIESEIPDFPYYHKCVFVGYAAIQAVELKDDHIKVNGILKGDNYPDKVEVKLADINSQFVLILADYLTATNC